MAAQTVFSVEMFPVGVSLMDDTQSLSDMPRNTLPAPQLVMLANVAAVTEGGSGSGSSGDGSAADEKEMMELKTVGCNYSDSEDENIIRYSYDNQNQREVCIIEYPEPLGTGIEAVIVGNDGEEQEDDKAEDLSPPPSCQQHQNLSRAPNVRTAPLPSPWRPQKKKPFHCTERAGVRPTPRHTRRQQDDGGEPGRGQEQDQDQRGGDTRVPEPAGREAEGGGEAAAGDIKGLIRCERCGYNTNRYDHYIAHLKHHSKEGDDHRVFKCTLCPYTTVSQYHWRKHLRNHFPSKLHTCSQCSYFSDRKSNYVQHIRTHTGFAAVCGLSVIRTDFLSWTLHVIIMCPSVPVSVCEYSSSQKTHLTRHMRTHSGERPFKCESCNYLAANQHEVTRHARQVHNGPKPLSCPYCEYKTADRSNFKKHVELHLNPRQFLCPLCKYARLQEMQPAVPHQVQALGLRRVVDISKVKLRVKKPGSDGTEETSRADKFDNSSSVEEDFDMDEDDSVDSSPINLSIRESVGQLAQSGASDKVQKKSNVTSEKVSKVKDKSEPEKRVTTRQKKMERINENPSVKEPQTETPNNKSKRRVKKLPAAEKTTVQDQTPGPETNRDQQRPEEEQAARPEKEKEHQKNNGSGKENKGLNKKGKSGSKKSDKTLEPVEEAQQKQDSPDKVQKVKEKTAKRKAVEALDLSKKTESETPSKTRRLKASKSAPEDTKKTNDATTPNKSNGTTPIKQKTRNASKKATGLQQSVDLDKDKTDSEPCPTQKNSSTEKTEQDQMDSSPSCSSGEDIPCPAELHPPPTFLKPTSPPSLVLPVPQRKLADPEDDEGIHSSHEGGSDISDSASEGSEDSDSVAPVLGRVPPPPQPPPVNVYYMDAAKGQK
ncbi:RE1-silencing transcription factor [Collichthys lucidus]|uniref:RE1-silencing transcription factor n=1 Tax=Collichthys lucidus TaxID=240159 RepID=A0A4U5TU03_COLLU|nr:RE1-silencing transcription factor [Collichthys lucidus]